MRRMDRYKEDDTPRLSRMDKNQELYQNISTNTIYTNITDVVNANAFEIKNNNNTSHRTREDYQQMRKYQNIEPVERNKKELEDVNYLYQKQQNKIYDINSFMEEARKNRSEKDDRESKRKLKNNAYNILSGVNKEELEKYREEKRKRLTTPEEEEIRELIDTIASKTLAGEIDKATSVDLLSDLMATNILDKVDNIEKIDAKENEEKANEEKKELDKTDNLLLSKEIIDKDQVEDIKKESVKAQDEKMEEWNKKDPDFYTRSMDLSDKDFNFNDDLKEKKLPWLVKFLLFLIFIGVVAVIAYFVYQKVL